MTLAIAIVALVLAAYALHLTIVHEMEAIHFRLRYEEHRHEERKRREG